MKTYKCDRCFKKFSQKSHYISHQNRKSKCEIVSLFKCYRCLNTFSSLATLRLHLNYPRLCTLNRNKPNIILEGLEDDISNTRVNINTMKSILKNKILEIELYERKIEIKEQNIEIIKLNYLKL